MANIIMDPLPMTALNVGKSLSQPIHNIVSSIYGNLSGQNELKMQEYLMNRQNAYNTIESQKNRDFQAYMSNTAYQRMADDLKKAGFNPALMISNGGASTPSGSMANMSLGQAPNLTYSSSSRYNTNVRTAFDFINNLVSNATKLASSTMSMTGNIASTALGVILKG